MDDLELEKMLAASRPPGLRMKSLDDDGIVVRHDNATRAFDQRVVHLMGRIMAPVIGGHVKELRAANEALARRVAELETRLDLDGRLRDVEQRLAALPAGPRRVA